MKKFNTGNVYMTQGVAVMADEHDDFNAAISIAFGRYCMCDWGDTCSEDTALNDEAVASGEGRILAVYKTSHGTIWIITETDRSATTVLFPNEY